MLINFIKLWVGVLLFFFIKEVVDFMGLGFGIDCCDLRIFIFFCSFVIIFFKFLKELDLWINIIEFLDVSRWFFVESVVLGFWDVFVGEEFFSCSWGDSFVFCFKGDGFVVGFEGDGFVVCLKLVFFIMRVGVFVFVSFLFFGFWLFGFLFGCVDFVFWFWIFMWFFVMKL